MGLILTARQKPQNVEIPPPLTKVCAIWYALHNTCVYIVVIQCYTVYICLCACIHMCI